MLNVNLLMLRGCQAGIPNTNKRPITPKSLGTGWCVSVSQPPAEVCLTDLAWDYPGV